MTRRETTGFSKESILTYMRAATARIHAAIMLETTGQGIPSAPTGNMKLTRMGFVLGWRVFSCAVYLNMQTLPLHAVMILSKG